MTIIGTDISGDDYCLMLKSRCLMFSVQVMMGTAPKAERNLKGGNGYPDGLENRYTGLGAECVGVLGRREIYYNRLDIRC
jgi:hypothetical protein